MSTQQAHEAEIEELSAFFDELEQTIEQEQKEALKRIKARSLDKLRKLHDKESRIVNNITRQLRNVNNKDKIAAAKDELINEDKTLQADLKQLTEKTINELDNAGITRHNLDEWHRRIADAREEFAKDRQKKLEVFGDENLFPLRYASFILETCVPLDPNNLQATLPNYRKKNTASIWASNPAVKTSELNRQSDDAFTMFQDGESRPSLATQDNPGLISATQAGVDIDISDVSKKLEVEVNDWLRASHYFPYSQLKAEDAAPTPDYIHPKAGLKTIFHPTSNLYRKRNENNSITLEVKRTSRVGAEVNAKGESLGWDSKHAKRAIDIMIVDAINILTHDPNGNFIENSKNWGTLDLSKVNAKYKDYAYEVALGYGIPAKNIKGHEPSYQAQVQGKARNEKLKNDLKKAPSENFLVATFKSWIYKDPIPNQDWSYSDENFVSNATPHSKQTAEESLETLGHMKSLGSEESQAYIKELSRLKQYEKLATVLNDEDNKATGADLVRIFGNLSDNKINFSKQQNIERDIEPNIHLAFYSKLFDDQKAMLIANIPTESGQETLQKMLFKDLNNTNQAKTQATILLHPELTPRTQGVLFDELSTSSTLTKWTPPYAKVFAAAIVQTDGSKPEEMQRLVTLYAHAATKHANNYDSVLFKELVNNKK